MTSKLPQGVDSLPLDHVQPQYGLLQSPFSVGEEGDHVQRNSLQRSSISQPNEGGSTDLLAFYPSPRNHQQALRQQLITHTLKLVEQQDTLIDISQIKVIEKIGEGRYGYITLGDVQPSTALANLYEDAIGQYKSKKSRKRQKVAVKQLHAHVQHHTQAVVGFMDEVQLLVTLQHPSIIRCLGVGTTHPLSDIHPENKVSLSKASAICSQSFVAMEYAKGGTLSQLLLRQMQQPAFHLYTMIHAVQWSRQIASGLAYLHDNDHLIIHRDLSTSNILLTKRNPKKSDVKLADFGLYRIVHEGTSWLQSANSNSQDSSSNTEDFGSRKNVRKCLAGHTYHLSGKTGNPLYMAPEVWLNQPYNEKVDIFAMGCVMFELFSYQLRVFDNMTQDVTYDHLLMQAAQMSVGIRPKFPAQIPDELKALIAQCWHQDLSQRPTAQEVEQRLQKIEKEMKGPKKGQQQCSVQ